MNKCCSRTVEVTVLSAEDLRINGRSVKKNAFAVVSIDPVTSAATKIDARGGSYPSWHDRLVMNLPLHVSFLILQVKSRASSGDQHIGSAKLPVSDFIGGYVPLNHLNFLSYLLIDARGNRSGIINVSVRITVPEIVNSIKESKAKSELRAQGYECSSQQKFGIPVGEKSFPGVVTGIPVRYPNQV